MQRCKIKYCTFYSWMKWYLHNVNSKRRRKKNKKSENIKTIHFRVICITFHVSFDAILFVSFFFLQNISDVFNDVKQETNVKAFPIIKQLVKHLSC